MSKAQSLFTVLVFSFSFTCAKQITVCQSCKVRSLAQAILLASAHDTILVKPGLYVSHKITISKPLYILGQAYPVIDLRGTDEGICINSPDVWVNGLDIRNTKTGSMVDYAGIRIIKSKRVHIINNRLINTFFGIYLSEVSHSFISNNQLSGQSTLQSQSGNGIHLWQCHHIIIEQNHITGHRDGIYFEFARYCQIRKNLSEKNFRYGLHFMFSDNDTYIGNIFRNNGTGVAVMYTKGIRMLYNHFENNWGNSSYGLLLKDISDSYITGNSFHNNTTAMYAEGSSRIQVSNNRYTNNGWALRLLANCGQDSFKYNHFSGNTFDVTTNGKLYLNYFSHNYWAKYEGYDLDRNNIGDIPHRPVSLFSMIIEQIPCAVILMRSFAVELLERAEKNIPSLIPEEIMDQEPLMKQRL